MQHTNLLVLIFLMGFTFYANAEKILVKGGEFFPQFGPGGSKLAVKMNRFELDRAPVSRADFAEFIKANPAWRKSEVKRSFAEKRYLNGWAELQYPKGTGAAPVVDVSYYAAAAFCESRGGRLPTTLEFEYFINVQTKSSLLSEQELYSQLWEWTIDYNSSFVTSDSRENGEMNKNFFCGSGAMTAADRKNYPAFMRYAMRSGLRPHFTIANLGFRCAYDIP